MTTFAELFAENDGNGEGNDAELMKALEEISGHFIEELEKAAEEMAEAIEVGSYWKYEESPEVVTLARVLEKRDHEIVVRAVRLGGSNYGPRVSIEPASVIQSSTIPLFMSPIEKVEYDEAMNKAFLMVDEVCHAERYGDG